MKKYNAFYKNLYILTDGVMGLTYVQLITISNWKFLYLIPYVQVLIKNSEQLLLKLKLRNY